MVDALDDLEQFLHESSFPVLILLAVAHYQFEVIHPFLDGNGRVGRLMVPLVLIERGALPQPLLYLSVYFERNRSRYYDLLLETSRTGDLEPWIKFFLRGIASQARDALERTVRLVELQQSMRIGLLDQRASSTAVRTAELLFDTPYVSATWLAERLAVTFPTAQSAIDYLVERGDLTEITGRKRNRFYFAPKIFEAVYATPDQPTEEQPRPFEVHSEQPKHPAGDLRARRDSTPRPSDP